MLIIAQKHTRRFNITHVGAVITHVVEL